MKRRLLFSVALLLFIGFTGCKKQDYESQPLMEKIIGRWQVTKIDVTTNNSNGPAVVSTSYTSADYIEFKESGQVEFMLGGTRSVGTYTTDYNYRLHIDLSSKDLEAAVNVITDKRLEFTGTVVESNPRVTETYILVR